MAKEDETGEKREQEAPKEGAEPTLTELLDDLNAAYENHNELDEDILLALLDGIVTQLPTPQPHGEKKGKI